MSRIQVYDRNGRPIPTAGLTRLQRFKLAAVTFLAVAGIIALAVFAVTAVLLVALPLLVLGLLVTLRIFWRVRRMSRMPRAQDAGRAPPFA